jgi:hypothetical protein
LVNDPTWFNRLNRTASIWCDSIDLLLDVLLYSSDVDLVPTSMCMTTVGYGRFGCRNRCCQSEHRQYKRDRIISLDRVRRALQAARLDRTVVTPALRFRQERRRNAYAREIISIPHSEVRGRRARLHCSPRSKPHPLSATRPRRLRLRPLLQECHYGLRDRSLPGRLL